MAEENVVFSCKELQQKFYENLGTREYDCFSSSEEKYIKLKIGFTLFGFPNDDEKFNNLNGDYTVEQGYDKNKNIVISNILEAIKANSLYNEDREQVVVSFMFNCCEYPKSKKLKNVENKTNVNIFPIFRVKKCFGSPTNKNCCVFIDEHSRVYKNWNDYLQNNKIPKAKMFVPKDGKYQGNYNDEVLLEEVLSPASALKHNILKAADISTTAVSVISGGVAIGSMIPAITIAPIILTGALMTGAGVGLYSIIRSSLQLHDRNTHCESISLVNKEARNCYLNIAAGATSVVTTGATKAATFALNKGVVFGEGTATALLSVNVMNLTVNGCNVANSVYSITSDIKNKKNPSPLDIMHLATTVLFFGNAVVNFKSACVIYQESQTQSFADIIKSQSQDLWNRAKQKFFNTDMTSTDSNSPVKILNDSGDYYSNAITCTTLEKESPISQNKIFEIFSKLISEIDLETALKFGLNIIQNKDNVQTLCNLILSRFTLEIQEKLLIILKHLLDDVISASYLVLHSIFPKKEILVILLNFIQQFLKLQVIEMEIEYQNKKAVNIQELQVSEDEYDRNIGGFRNNSERMTYYFKLCVLKMISNNGQPDEIMLRELIRYFWDWLNEKSRAYAFKQSIQVNKETETERKIVQCGECGGYFYVD